MTTLSATGWKHTKSTKYDHWFENQDVPLCHIKYSRLPGEKRYCVMTMMATERAETAAEADQLARFLPKVPRPHREQMLLYYQKLNLRQLFRVVWRGCVLASHYQNQPDSDVVWEYKASCAVMKQRGREDLVKIAYRLAMKELGHEDPEPGERLEEVLEEIGYRV